MAKKKLTPLQREYNKQVSRINRAVKQLETQGFAFSDEPYTPPKRATKKNIEKLKSITVRTLKQKAQYIDIDTGEVISTAREEARRRRSEASKKAWERRRQADAEYIKTITETQVEPERYPYFEEIVISNFKLEAEQFPEIAGPMIVNWVNSLIAQYGKEPVANMLQEGRENGLVIDYQIAYRKDLLTNFIAEMLDYLEVPEPEKRKIVDAFEMDEDWEEPE